VRYWPSLIPQEAAPATVAVFRQGPGGEPPVKELSKSDLGRIIRKAEEAEIPFSRLDASEPGVEGKASPLYDFKSIRLVTTEEALEEAGIKVAKRVQGVSCPEETVATGKFKNAPGLRSILDAWQCGVLGQVVAAAEKPEPGHLQALLQEGAMWSAPIHLRAAEKAARGLILPPA
jgi:hypothetical protein